MTAKSLKTELYKELKKNHLELVITKLKNIYTKSSEKYQELFSIAFQLNSLKNENRKGLFVKGVKDQEYNRIMNGLHLLIDELTEEDVFNYGFEHNYGSGNNATLGISGRSETTGWKKEVLNYLRYLKYLISLLLIMVLFVVDGMEMVETNLPLLECDMRVELLTEEVGKLVRRSNVNKALLELEESISKKSEFYDDIILMKNRFQRIERDNRKGVVNYEVYLKEQNKIGWAVLGVSNDIECDDLL